MSRPNHLHPIHTALPPPCVALLRVLSLVLARIAPVLPGLKAGRRASVLARATYILCIAIVHLFLSRCSSSMTRRIFSSSFGAAYSSSCSLGTLSFWRWLCTSDAPYHCPLHLWRETEIPCLSDCLRGCRADRDKAGLGGWLRLAVPREIGNESSRASSTTSFKQLLWSERAAAQRRRPKPKLAVSWLDVLLLS